MGADILGRKFASIQDWDHSLLYSETLHNTQQTSLKQNEEIILRDLCSTIVRFVCELDIQESGQKCPITRRVRIPVL